MTPTDELRQAATTLRSVCNQGGGEVSVGPFDREPLWIKTMPDDAVQPLVAWLEHEAMSNQPVTGTLALALARRINEETK